MANIDELVANFLVNPERAKEYTIEQLNEVRKRIDPIGNIIKSNESYINISIINMREDYIRKLTMTGLVGYLYRVLHEYVPEPEVQKITSKWEKVIAAADTQEAKQKAAQDRDAEIKLATATVRRLVEGFVGRHFKYNPDKHLRGAHGANKADPERPDPAVLKQQYQSGQSSALQGDALNALQDNLLSGYQTVAAANDIIKDIQKAFTEGNDIEDKIAILRGQQMALERKVSTLREHLGPIARAESVTQFVEPPIDVFYHLDRYIANHYEQLREVVGAVYNEKPDIELAAIYYDHFDTPEAARDHQIMHADDFRAGVFTISNTGVTFIGPFKKNRERVDFYNKNTDILKKMVEQMEQDHKLGKDIMEKEKMAKKIRNVREAGPDAPGLAEYIKTVGIAQELGGKSTLTREEQEQLNKANKIKDAVEGTDDAIEVGMFYPTIGPDGEQTLSKTAFYSQAEAPLHLQDGSVYVDKYQPKRPEGKKFELIERKVTDRNGNVKSIRDLKPDAPQ